MQQKLRVRYGCDRSIIADELKEPGVWAVQALPADLFEQIASRGLTIHREWLQNISCGRRHGLSRKSRMRLLLVEKDRSMQSLLKALTQKAVVLGLMLLIVFSSLNIFVAPSYAITASRDKLTSQDKIDRAYEYGEGAGILEEEKQASASAKQIFKPEDKANIKSVKASQATDSEKSLVEQGKDLLEKVTGK